MLIAIIEQDTEKLIPSRSAFSDRDTEWRLKLCFRNSEIDAIAKVLKDAYKTLDPKLSGEILGSYRREVKWCSDVDLILRHEDHIKVSSCSLHGTDVLTVSRI